MKISRIKTGFDSLTDSDFETKAGSIYAFMLGNTNFPTPTPDLPSVKGDIQAYQDALTAAQTKSKNDVAAKNDARKKLTASLVQLANSVTTTANGNRTMLISSGFDLAKDGEFTPIIKPEIITLSDGLNPGELMVKVSAVKGAKGYGPQYTTDPLTASSEWRQFMTTTSKFTFTNLEAAKKYWCRMAVIGAYGQIVYSDAVCRVVQ